MIRLYDKQTGEHIANAIKYNPKNTIEFKMFGITGTKEGRQTKIDCQGIPFVKNGNLFERLKNNYYVVQHGMEYKQMSVRDLVEQYETRIEQYGIKGD